MKKGLILTASLLLSITTLLSACGSNSQTSVSNSGSGSQIIKIATQTPLSGENAEMGEDIKLGVELAIKDNMDKFKQLGFDLQLLPKDDKADPATGTANAKALITDPDVLAVVGHLNSGVMAAAGTTYESAQLSTITPGATNPQLAKNGWSTFHRICGRDDNQGPAASKFIFDEGKKTVFIVDDSTDYGKGLAIEMETKARELGLQVIGHESVSAQEMEFNTLATKIKASGAEALYFGGMYAQAGQFLKQLSDKKFDGIFVSADGTNNIGFVQAAGANNVKNSYITSVVGDISSSPEGVQWSERFKKTFNKEPGTFAAYGYDATLVALNAIEKALKDNNSKKPSREQVNGAFSATSNFKGILTVTTFDENGENKNAVGYIKSFQKGIYPPEQIAEIQ